MLTQHFLSDECDILRKKMSAGTWLGPPVRHSVLESVDPYAIGFTSTTFEVKKCSLTITHTNDIDIPLTKVLTQECHTARAST